MKKNKQVFSEVDWELTYDANGNPQIHVCLEALEGFTDSEREQAIADIAAHWREITGGGGAMEGYWSNSPIRENK